MSSEILTMHVTCIGGSEIHHEPQESIFRISRGEINTLTSKDSLGNQVLVGTRFQFVPRSELVFERKSKKQQGFVSLETAADFKEFHRSLKVKNNMKLVVRRNNRHVFETELSRPQAVPPTTLLVSEAGDQLRKLISEFQKSEIYDLLKSFSGLYKQAMAPDGCFSTTETSADLGGSSEEKVAANTEDHEGLGSRGLVHDGVMCDQCEPTDKESFIKGLRYKCVVCNDFDLCSECYKTHTSSGTHSSQHAMVAVEDTEAFKRFLKFGGHPGPSSFFTGGRNHPSQIAEPLFPQKRNNEKTEEETKLVAEKARKYEELESILEGDHNSKFEKLKELVVQAQGAEKVFAKELAERESKMAQEAQRELEDEPETPEEPFFAGLDIYLREPPFVEVAVIPKGRSLSQILIINKGENTIPCNGMTLEIMNCFGMTVASVPIEKNRGIAPNRASKFNVCVSNTHFKYPFKIVLNSAAIAGECLLSLKNMCGTVVLLPKIPLESPANSVETEKFSMEDSQMEGVTRHASGSSSASFATASVHSILLPLLPKEVQSQASQGSSDTTTDVRMTDDQDEEEENEDYDLISVTEVEDLESDYELLSEGGSVQ